jgi:hypothetical protein
MAGSSTVRFRAESRVVYARALLALTEHARTSASEFTFGPLHMAALEEQGLAVTGPDVQAWADDFLAEIPGLHRADDLARGAACAPLRAPGAGYCRCPEAG